MLSEPYPVIRGQYWTPIKHHHHNNIKQTEGVYYNKMASKVVEPQLFWVPFYKNMSIVYEYYSSTYNSSILFFSFIINDNSTKNYSPTTSDLVFIANQI